MSLVGVMLTNIAARAQSYTSTYTYDSLGRVGQQAYPPENGNANALNYAYDPADNRTSTLVVPARVVGGNIYLTATPSQAITILPSDIAGDTAQSTLTFTTIGTASYGMTSFTSGSATYRPNNNAGGRVDSFTYTLTSANGNVSGRVNVTVAPLPPLANAVTVNAAVGQTIQITPPISDPQGVALTLASVSKPQSGRASISGNTISYTAPSANVGSDTFTYTVTNAYNQMSGALVTVSISAAPLPPDQ